MAEGLKWFRILRPINLLLFLLGQILVFYHLLWHDIYVDSITFFLLVLSSLSIAAFSNIYNDLVDLPADLINKPQKINLTPTSKPLTTYYMLFWMSVAVLSTLIYFVRSENILVTTVIFLQLPLSVWYSASLKKTTLWGNILIALQCVLVLMIIYWNSLSISDISTTFRWQIYFLLGFVALSTLARELTKDVLDTKGDQAIGASTFPIRFGYIRSNTLIKFYLILSLALIIYMPSFFANDAISVGLFYLLGLCIAVLFYYSYKVQFRELSLGLKVYIGVGIASFAYLFWASTHILS